MKIENETQMVAPQKARMNTFYRGFWAYAYLFSLFLQAGVAATLIWPKHPLDATIYEEDELSNIEVKVIEKISYDELPPPPSLMEAPEVPPESLAEGTVGDSPMPVPDELAERDTMVDTQAGTTDGNPLGNGVVVEDGSVKDAPEDHIAFVAYDTAPSFIDKIEPVYPELGRASGTEGVVQLMVYVGADGKVKNVIVTGPMGLSEFNEAAVTAAYQCTFTPATSGGQPIGVWLALPMYFHLK
jgi:protein TonB